MSLQRKRSNQEFAPTEMGSMTTGLRTSSIARDGAIRAGPEKMYLDTDRVRRFLGCHSTGAQRRAIVLNDGGAMGHRPSEYQHPEYLHAPSLRRSSQDVSPAKTLS